MAERIVSPGVFTNEVDQSFLAGGVAQIGAAIVGPTTKGPALVPTKIENYNEFTKIFGEFNSDNPSYIPLVVQDYLRNSGTITVTRLLYEDGYKLTSGGLAIIAKSGSGASAVEVVTHVLHPVEAVTTTGATALFEDSVLEDDGTENCKFALKISGSYSAGANNAIGFDGSFLEVEGAPISASIILSDNNYISKVFGRNPKSVDYPVYVQYENKTASSLFERLDEVTMELGILSNYEFLQDYNTASTPWITSQKIGASVKNLFKFHTLSHGTAVSHEIKVAIRNIQLSNEIADPNGYGSFDVQLRRVNTNNESPVLNNSPFSSNDTNSNIDEVEIYNGVNLDPKSPNYIARRIGDRYQTINDSNEIIVSGDYLNISKFVRVEVTSGVRNASNDKNLIPFGFRALNSPIPNASASLNLTATTYYTSQVQNGNFSNTNYYGFNFDNETNLNYLAPVPTSGSTTGSNADFYLGDVSQDAEANFPSATNIYSGTLENGLTGSLADVSLSTRRFIVPMQGGFDGARPNLPKYSGEYISSTNTFGFDCSGNSATGTAAYNKAFALLSNTDYYDMNLLITPGIIDRLHASVTNKARLLAENRQDTFYVMDTNALTDTNDTVISQVTSIDSSYTATYWPWVKIPNTEGDTIWVPPSVVLPGVLAFNDKDPGAPWYAPAGLTRGGLSALQTYKNLSQSDRDKLYLARVNPIANFPNEGIVVWGQKTLQARPSALDRVNVRRLLIAVKKFIASSTKYLVFEQNTSATRTRFLNIVNPYLNEVKANQGLYAFRVVMDSTNNTPDVIDQNILYGQLFLQPTRTAEFIILDFNIQPTGAEFGG